MYYKWIKHAFPQISLISKMGLQRHRIQSSSDPWWCISLHFSRTFMVLVQGLLFSEETRHHWTKQIKKSFVKEKSSQWDHKRQRKSAFGLHDLVQFFQPLHLLSHSVNSCQEKADNEEQESEKVVPSWAFSLFFSLKDSRASLYSFCWELSEEI